MKTIAKFIFMAACISLLFACTKTDNSLGTDTSGNPLKSARADPKTVTVPFKADFTGTYTYVGTSEKCGDSLIQVIVDLKGTGTHLGNFTGNFNFCAGEAGYGPTDSYMIAANGDILYVSCAGQVHEGRLADHPPYVISYWRDPFVISGGTGRFEGATGSGMTDDFNSSLDPYSHHHWSGTITLVKGKR